MDTWFRFSWRAPMRMMLPVCSMGGLAATSRTRWSPLPLPQLERTRPWMTTCVPDPRVMWMLPEPVATLRSTRPLTERVRSKVASDANAGSAAKARAATAATRIFMGVPQGSGFRVQWNSSTVVAKGPRRATNVDGMDWHAGGCLWHGRAVRYRTVMCRYEQGA